MKQTVNLDGSITKTPYTVSELAQMELDRPTQEQLDIRASELAKIKLIEIDISSIRSIREWLAAQPSAPQTIKDKEALAASERVKVKP